jgi:hypothetical protein
MLGGEIAGASTKQHGKRKSSSRLSDALQGRRIA